MRSVKLTAEPDCLEPDDVPHSVFEEGARFQEVFRTW
jgi:hypothetical protein